MTSDMTYMSSYMLKVQDVAAPQVMYLLLQRSCCWDAGMCLFCCTCFKKKLRVVQTTEALTDLFNTVQHKVESVNLNLWPVFPVVHPRTCTFSLYFILTFRFYDLTVGWNGLLASLCILNTCLDTLCKHRFTVSSLD